MELENSTDFSNDSIDHARIYSFYGRNTKRSVLVPLGSGYYRRIGDVHPRDIYFPAPITFKEKSTALTMMRSKEKIMFPVKFIFKKLVILLDKIIFAIN